MSRPTTLLAITVYNGRRFVPTCLESAARIDRTDGDLDVVVLDDASPEPGWSSELAGIAEGLGFQYYRASRNLGIPRNVSLGLQAAVEGDYDNVVISNSDVVYPSNLLTQMLRAVASPRVGSVTAWSNNVSIYSLTNDDPDANLSEQGVVDWISASLAGHYGDALIDVPAGISFCIMIPTHVVREVGVMDPVFGRGYCEETDWSLRSLAMGYRIGLAPGVFVYHSGRGSNLDAGLLSHDTTSVPANEAIIDLRYPLFRSQVAAFSSSGLMERAIEGGVERIVKDAGQQFGYQVELGWMPMRRVEAAVVALVAPDGLGDRIALLFRGFRHLLPIQDEPIHQTLERFFGAQPRKVIVRDQGAAREQLSTWAENDSIDWAASTFYPTRV